MSGKQGPARVRVFSSQGEAPHPMRRRTDRVPLAEDAAAPASSAAAAGKPAGLSRRLLTLIFFIGCAAGGAIVSYAGLLQEAAQ